MSSPPAGAPAYARAPLGLAVSRTTGRPWPVLFSSLLLHTLVVWLFLPHQVRRPGADTPPVIEVEMIDQAAQQRGADPASPNAPQASPQAPNTPPPPAEPSPDAPPAAPTANTPPAHAAAPTPLAPAPATVHLGGGPEDRDPLIVTGTNVVPPRPDARIRNKPPTYPADAARRHAQGTVGLRVHVTEQGLAAWVDVVQTSGDTSLDSAAQEAVSLWRFQPARAGGTAVPFDYALEIRFRMDDP